MTIPLNCLPEGAVLTDLVRQERIISIDIRFCRNDGWPGETSIIPCDPSEAEFATIYGMTERGEAVAIHDVDFTRAGPGEIAAACRALFTAILSVQREQGMTQDGLDPGQDEALRAAARRHYGSDHIEIDADATISGADDGAWVAAWLWVSHDGAEEQA